jgi:hypothetical protein
VKVIRDTPDVLAMRPTSQGLWTLFGGLIFAVAGLFAAFLAGSTVWLVCERVEPQVNRCTVDRRLFGLSWRQNPIKGLRGAQVAERRDSDGDLLYRVVFLTDEGQVPLTSSWSSGSGSKARFVQEVDAFVQDAEARTVEVAQRGTTGLLFSLVFVVIGILGCGLGIRTLLTTWIFDRTQRAVVRQVAGLTGVRAIEYDLDDVIDVQVQHSQGRSSRGSSRPVLFFRSGEIVPLVSLYISGRGPGRVVQVIRDWLGLDQIDAVLPRSQYQ